MKCSLCGFKFDEKGAEAACAACGLVRRCELVKCPNCGFEMPLEPEWIKKIKKRRLDSNGTDR